jgi:hypothetical protein
MGPTLYLPAYVVTRIGNLGHEDHQMWYDSTENGAWTTNPEEATIFDSLMAAAAVATAENAEVHVIWDDEQLRKYRKEEIENDSR